MSTIYVNIKLIQHQNAEVFLLNDNGVISQHRAPLPSQKTIRKKKENLNDTNNTDLFFEENKKNNSN